MRAVYIYLYISLYMYIYTLYESGLQDDGGDKGDVQHDVDNTNDGRDSAEHILKASLFLLAQEQ